MNKLLYLPIPVEEGNYPEEDSHEDTPKQYIVIMYDVNSAGGFDTFSVTAEQMKNVNDYCEHAVWLKPVSKEDYDKAIAEKAFQAGDDFGNYDFIQRNKLQKQFLWMQDEIPVNKEQYLKSLNKTGEQNANE